jgi:hypothetical protein
MILPALQALTGGRTYFAIYAIKRTGLPGNQVHPQREPQATGINRSEEVRHK